MWTNPEQVRKVIGLKVEDVSDEELEHYIDMAQKEVRDQISCYVYDEVLSGEIDGVNTTFSTRYAPLADVNFDGTVTPEDVEVYKWGVLGSLDTRVKCNVSRIYWYNGTIVLDSPPASTFEAVTCNYAYYPVVHIDMSRIQYITALLAGYYYVRSELLLVPQSWAHGAYRFSKGDPLKILLEDYYRELENLLGKKHMKEKHGELEFIRGEEDVEG